MGLFDGCTAAAIAGEHLHLHLQLTSINKVSAGYEAVSKNRIKRLISLVLIPAIILTLFTAIPFTVSAAGQNWLRIIQPEDESGNRIELIKLNPANNWMGEFMPVAEAVLDQDPDYPLF